MTGWRLVSDVGGTNVRFARAQNGGALLEHRGYPVSAHKDYLSAVHAYLDETGGLAGCTGAAIGAAGAIDNGKVSLTNAAWGIAEAEVASAIGAPCTLVNDLQAVAFSLPVLDEADVEVLGDLAPNLTAARRVLTANIGTGFGAATLIRTADGWTSCPSEAGHMSIAFPEGRDGAMHRQFTSVERVLSGQGLSDLHAAIANEPGSLHPAEVIAQVKTNPHSSEALRLFTLVAGDVLGNLVLAVAAWDGVYLFGSVAKSFAKVADLGLLRQAFEKKGPMTARMKQVPIALITLDDAPLAGLASLPLGTKA